jgi:D-alanyl-D-alanine carboxypeptidase
MRKLYLKKEFFMRRVNNTVIYICAALITLLLFSMLTVYATSGTEHRRNARISGAMANDTSVAASGNIRGISAKAAVLYEPVTGEILYEKNADARLPMASTTKIMTAIVVAERCRTDEVITIGPESVGIEGSSAYLREGDEYTIEELLYALMLQSANDAATALAYYTAGGISEFAELMNEKAAELRLDDTHFTNPHGLDDEEHYTTASDLAKIGAELLKNDLLKRIVSTYKKTFTYGERTRNYINHNKLLHRYDGAIGMKTGFTKRSGRCLVGAAERDGLMLISVTLDAPSDWSDHAALFDFGFDTLECLTLCGEGDYLQEMKIVGGEKDSILISAEKNLAIIKKNEEYTIKEYIELSRYGIAPIKTGDIVGRVVFKVGDELYSVNLIAREDAALKDEGGILKKIFSNIFKRG